MNNFHKITLFHVIANDILKCDFFKVDPLDFGLTQGLGSGVIFFEQCELDHSLFADRSNNTIVVVLTVRLHVMQRTVLRRMWPCGINPFLH